MKAAEVRQGTSGIHRQDSDPAWARSCGMVPEREQELTYALTELLWLLRGGWIPGLSGKQETCEEARAGG